MVALELSIDEALLLEALLRRCLEKHAHGANAKTEGELLADSARVHELIRRLKTAIANAQEEAQVSAPIAP